MKTIEIFDNNMTCECIECDICEVEADISIQVKHIKKLIKGKNLRIERYNLDLLPEAKKRNNDVTDLIAIKGKDVLPITTIDGKVVKKRAYPTDEEFVLWFGINKEDLLNLAYNRVCIISKEK